MLRFELDLFGNRECFACQVGLVTLEVHDFEQPEICGYGVSHLD
jgi:hypothetical protein